MFYLNDEGDSSSKAEKDTINIRFSTETILTTLNSFIDKNTKNELLLAGVF